MLKDFVIYIIITMFKNLPASIPSTSKQYIKHKYRKRSGKVAEKVKKYVDRKIDSKRAIRQFTYEPFAGGEVTTTATIDDLTAVAKVSGSDDPETYRDEQQIEPLNLVLSGVWAAKTTSQIDNYLRVIVFTWREERGANPPGVAELFGSNFTYNYLAPVFHSIDCVKGTVLYDRLFYLGPQDNTTVDSVANRTSRPIIKKINLKNHPKIKYLSNAGTSGQHHIYLLVLGNTVTGTNSSTLQLDSMLQYQE